MAKEDKPIVKMTKEELQQGLIDNFIALQKVLVNFSIKFEELSVNISRLLQLFEISAKTFAERYSGKEPLQETAVDIELIKKLDLLLDQNKVISKGIMLMEEKISEKNNIFNDSQGANQQTPLQMQYPYPPMQQPYPMPPQGYPQIQQPYPGMQPVILPSMQQQFPQQNISQNSPSPYKKEIGAREAKPLPKN